MVAGVEDPGDVLVVHHRQGLALGLEAGDDLAAVHAGLDDLERDLAADRLLLLGHVDDAHAPFADLLEQLVGADDRAGLSRERLVAGRRRVRDRGVCRKLPSPGLGGQQCLDAAAQLADRRRRLRPGRRPGRSVGSFIQSGGEDCFRASRDCS